MPIRSASRAGVALLALAVPAALASVAFVPGAFAQSVATPAAGAVPPTTTTPALQATAPQAAPAPAQPTPAQPAPVPATSADVAPVPMAPVAVPAKVEQSLRRIHSQLKITSAQAPQWTAFADVMRQNAEHMETIAKQHPTRGTHVNAVDGLKSAEDVAQAHLEDLQRLTPAFASLYATLSPSQKKAADGMFHNTRTTVVAAKKSRHGSKTASAAAAAPATQDTE